MYEICNIYLENHIVNDTINFLEQFNCYYAFIIHDKDRKENGELKKPHYHIILDYNNNTHDKKELENFIKKNFDKNAFINTIRNIKRATRYLTHIDHKHKYQYKDIEIITNNKEEYEALKEINEYKEEKTKINDILINMIQEIDNLNILSEQQCFQFFLKYNKLDYYINHKKNLLQFIDDRIQQNNYKNDR